MVGEQVKYRSYEELVQEYKEKYGIEIGSFVLIPAVNGRKQKKKVDYGEMIDLVGMQSGQHVIMFRQRNKKLLFTIEELEKCWRKCSAEPRVRKILQGGQDGGS